MHGEPQGRFSSYGFHFILRYAFYYKTKPVFVKVFAGCSYEPIAYQSREKSL